MHYYELLVGFDLSAFPSYYEPWGYTPLESLAFHVPTITQTLQDLNDYTFQINKHWPGNSVINRTDSNDKDVVNKITSTIKEYA